MSEDDPKLKEESPGGVSRRDFLKIGAISVAVPAVMGPRVVEAAGQKVPVYGPGKTPITLNVNGKLLHAELEPRVTLLDALREQFDLTGPKRVCNHGECGACTVLIDGKTAYSCSTLAIDAQGKKITTIEGLTTGEQLSPVMTAFVANDAQQCGFCTPGFIMATTALLQEHPHPTPEQARRGLSGNFCRCGTYHGMQGVVAQMAKPAAAQPAPKKGA